MTTALRKAMQALIDVLRDEEPKGVAEIVSEVLCEGLAVPGDPDPRAFFVLGVGVPGTGTTNAVITTNLKDPYSMFESVVDPDVERPLGDNTMRGCIGHRLTRPEDFERPDRAQTRLGPSVKP